MESMRRKDQIYVCEVCGGTFIGTPVVVDLGSYKLTACPSCARSLRASVKKKEEIKEEKKPVKIREEPIRTVRRSQPGEMELVEGFGRIIRRAREDLGLTIDQLAKAIGIKSSLLRHIEAEEIVPSPEIAKSLERVLEVSITVRNPAYVEELERERAESFHDRPTLGEMIRIKDKEGKKGADEPSS
ncbi:MAG: TIGR00270 family protein [Thermoproteota archaeon]|nr:MAG: TIGR00270 family protein [Candidatus Korarchaeota archaeon]